jgi:hypothetical protein
MAGIITKRSEEEVKDWLVDRIDKYQIDTEDSELVYKLEEIKDSVKYFDNMLTKAQATLLDKLVQEDATEVLGRGNDGYMTAIQYIDELSIYTDVWQMYLRPGTYSVGI